MERNDLFSPFLDLHKSKGHVYFPWLFWAAARKGTKSCRTQGDFRSSYLKKWMRCYRGPTEGIQEPKLRSKKADVRPDNANLKFERADLRLERAGLRPKRPEN